MIRIPVIRPELPDRSEALLASLRRNTHSGRISHTELPKVYEKSLASYIGTLFAVSLDALSDGVQAVFHALGMGEGDEVITASFIPHALITTMLSTGVRITFADLRPGSYSICPEDVERRITPHTRAVILTHPFGLPSEAVAMATLCRQYDITLIEVMESGLGSRIDQHHIGSFGYAGIFHFHPRRSLIGGDGCFVATNEAHVASACRNWHGKGQRLSPFHAALGIHHLEIVEPYSVEREDMAAYYDVHLAGVRGLRLVQPQFNARWNHPYYIVRMAELSKRYLADALLERGIATSYGPRPAHMHPYIETLLRPSRLTFTEELYHETFLLPLYNGLTREEQDEIVSCIKEVLS